MVARGTEPSVGGEWRDDAICVLHSSHALLVALASLRLAMLTDGGSIGRMVKLAEGGDGAALKALSKYVGVTFECASDPEARGWVRALKEVTPEAMPEEAAHDKEPTIDKGGEGRVRSRSARPRTRRSFAGETQ